MSLLSANRATALRLLAECGRISSVAFKRIMPYSYRNNTIVLKKLVSENMISHTGSTEDKSYTLLAKGRNELAGINPQRYTPELFELNAFLRQHPRQSRLCGDVTAMMSLADYAVHSNEKPILPATTPNYEEDTADQMKTVFSNGCLQDYSPHSPDPTLYTRRLTPVNCYYDRTQIKLMQPEYDNGVRSARATGVLLTPSHRFRVYHGEKHNIKFWRNAEEYFARILEEAFPGYRPPQGKAVLLLGRDFEPAQSLIGSHLAERHWPSGKGTLLSPSNLGAPLHYLPAASQSLELLRVMRYPDWHKSIMTFASEVMFGIPNQQAWSYEHNGCHVYIVADLNLTNLTLALRQVREKPSRKTIFLCTPWQETFVRELILYSSDASPHVKLECLPADFLSHTTWNALETYWGESMITSM